MLLCFTKFLRYSNDRGQNSHLYGMLDVNNGVGFVDKDVAASTTIKNVSSVYVASPLLPLFGPVSISVKNLLLTSFGVCGCQQQSCEETKSLSTCSSCGLGDLFTGVLASSEDLQLAKVTVDVLVSESLAACWRHFGSSIIGTCISPQ